MVAINYDNLVADLANGAAEAAAASSVDAERTGVDHMDDTIEKLLSNDTTATLGFWILLFQFLSQVCEAIRSLVADFFSTFKGCFDDYIRFELAMTNAFLQYMFSDRWTTTIVLFMIFTFVLILVNTVLYWVYKIDPLSPRNTRQNDEARGVVRRSEAAVVEIHEDPEDPAGGGALSAGGPREGMGGARGGVP
mmetsp:Transcript_68224/g.189289  ORF Transcript_68224/g.189289 Transcript_68224/m.189289 type:complete len:193 (-) Transcript_68224:1765-2343(-)